MDMPAARERLGAVIEDAGVAAALEADEVRRFRADTKPHASFSV
jgi:hypothetical protein